MPMFSHPSEVELRGSSLEAFLLGQIDFDRVLALQRRLVVECGDRDDGQMVLLLCEHPAIITVGRGGSPGDIHMQSGLIRNRQIDVRWVNRGGGCLVHCPGQLAIYPIVPLRWHGFTVGEFLQRFSRGIIESLDELNIPVKPHPAVVPDRLMPGVWGRTGQLAAIGVAVRGWVTYYGAYLNVCPPMGLFRLVESDPHGKTRVAKKGTGPFCAKHRAPTEGWSGRSGKMYLSPFLPKMSSLVTERRGPVKMTAVRATLIRRLAECFGCDRYHLYTGHPLLRPNT